MKRVINGKRYDTDTATPVAEWGNDLSDSDFRAESETLYLTRKGAWFLHGSGGPLSSYAVVSHGGREQSGSSVIEPYTPDAAKEWLESRGQYDALERFFGDSLDDA